MEKLRTILHTGNISIREGNDYSTWVVLQGAEWSNSLIKFNFKLFDVKPIAVFFRYNDPQNYYGIEFDLSKGIIKLFKKIESLTTVIETQSSKMLLDKWYRVSLVLSFNYIKMSIQAGSIWQERLIFSREIDGLSRGTLAFGTTGNRNFFVSGIEVDEYKENKKIFHLNNKRTWTELLKSLSYRERKIHCMEVYDQDIQYIRRCVEVYFYCKLRCDEIIPSVENILNYSCFKDCKQTAFNLGKKIQSLDDKTREYIPKANDKVDYKPADSPNFRQAVIKEVKTVKDKIVVEISYEDQEGKNTITEDNFNGENIKKCGVELSLRNDCISN
jgi:hypothetical protein